MSEVRGLPACLPSTAPLSVSNRDDPPPCCAPRAARPVARLRAVLWAHHCLREGNDGRIAILDGTNTTKAKRQFLLDALAPAGAKVRPGARAGREARRRVAT